MVLGRNDAPPETMLISCLGFIFQNNSIDGLYLTQLVVLFIVRWTAEQARSRILSIRQRALSIKESQGVHDSAELPRIVLNPQRIFFDKIFRSAPIS